MKRNDREAVSRRPSLIWVAASWTSPFTSASTLERSEGRKKGEVSVSRVGSLMMYLLLPSRGRVLLAAGSVGDICHEPGRLSAGDDRKSMLSTWSWSMSRCERVRETGWRTNIW